MLSFHSDVGVKHKYINRVREHRAAERIIKGIGWQNGRGCAVGCTLKAYDHARYPVELGLPEWLARLEDAIFENLPNGSALGWPERFLSAIPVGVDVDPIRHDLAIRRMDRMLALLPPVLGITGDEILSALRGVRAAHDAARRGVAAEWTDAGKAAWDIEARAAAEARRAASPALKAAWSAVASAAACAGWSAATTSDGMVEGAVACVECAVACVECAIKEGSGSVGQIAELATATMAWQQEADVLIELMSSL